MKDKNGCTPLKKCYDFGKFGNEEAQMYENCIHESCIAIYTCMFVCTLIPQEGVKESIKFYDNSTINFTISQSII